MPLTHECFEDSGAHAVLIVLFLAFFVLDLFAIDDHLADDFLG